MFGPLTHAQFLEQHWQRRAAFFPGALPGYGSPLSPDELAGLACEEHVESRLVLGTVETRFALEHGPFEEARLERLPGRGWTLLVQDVDKHVPSVAALLERFRFLPDWRVDDIMVSFAAPDGSVGPHTDEYDVFLLQVQGRRRWQLAERFAPGLRADCDIKVLERFAPQRELVAEPGDLLYLPPNVAHFGLALDEALTFSIGFRAPGQSELLTALLEDLIARPGGGPRFGDAGRRPVADPTRIEAADLAALRALVRQGLELSDAELDEFLGRQLARSKPHLEVAAEATSAEDVQQRLTQGGVLVRRHGSRWAATDSEGELRVFSEGRAYRLLPRQREWLAPLLAGAPLTRRAFGDDAGAFALLATWLEQGALEWQDDVED